MTVLAAKVFLAMDSDSCQNLFPSVCIQPSEEAVLFDWNLSRSPSQTGSLFRSAGTASLHRIQYGTCGFVPMPRLNYFHSETYE